MLPSLVSAPEPLSRDRVGPEGRLRVVEHVGTRGRLNRYAAIWRQDDGAEIEVELREGPADHAGLRRESEILAGSSTPCCRATTAWEQPTGGIWRSTASTARRWSGARRPACPPSRRSRCPAAGPGRASLPGRLGAARADARRCVARPADPSRAPRGRADRRAAAQALQVAGYSAPELAYRETVTGKEDVYTLGALLYAP